MTTAVETHPGATISSPVATLPQKGTAPASAAVSRDDALDFTKGALVLCMVAYHTLNYFRYDERILRHLHFLPPSFIFITGFLITKIYRPKIFAGDQRVYARLFTRGLKVLLLFVVTNVLVQATLQTSYNRNLGLTRLADNLGTIFLTGEGRATVFGVLLPISYLLLLSAALLRVGRDHRSTLPVATVAIVSLCTLLAYNGDLTFNLELLSMGLLGMMAGFIPQPRLDRVAKGLIPLAATYLAYSIAIHRWYPTYLINAAGVSFSLLLLYSLGRYAATWPVVLRPLALLGNYSLFSYLAQIAVLQILFRLSRHSGLFEHDVVGPFLATALVTFALVRLVNHLRPRSKVIDGAYKTVFA